MLPKKDLVRLRHILAAAQEAAASAEGRTDSDLTADRPLMHTLVHCLETIGEAANQVSIQTRVSLPQVSWKPMVDMRNRLIHAYHDVNLTVVWQTVTEDLPPLIAALEQVLAEHDSGQLI